MTQLKTQEDLATTQMEPDSDLCDIMTLLPHRFPMLMIDRVTNIILDQSATGIKNVTANEWYFQGHFPQKPVMPGVLIIEALAQTAAVLSMRTMGINKDNHLAYFMSIDEAKFRKMVVPGDVLHLDVEKAHRRGPVWKFKGYARVNGEVVAEATNTAMMSNG